MTTDNEKNNEVKNELMETPGDILSKKREEVGLSIDDVAEKLNLQPLQIRSLEKNDYDSFNVETYLKGYLRSYAKFIGVDGDKVVNLYKQQNTEKIIEIIPDVKPKSQRSSPNSSTKLFSYVIGLVVVLALIVWYQKEQISEPYITGKEISNIKMKKINKNNVDTSYEIITHSNYWQWPIDKSVENYVDSIEKNNQPSQAELNEDENVNSLEQNSVAEEVENEASYNIQEGTDTIVMNLTGDCWTEIEDRDGNKVFYDLAREGRRYVINGKSPMSVFLGAADEVSILFNGSTVDIKPYIKFGLARFTLPE